MAPKKQQISSKNPNNQPGLPNNFCLQHFDNQKLIKEVQDFRQITQSLMLAINKLLNEQNPQKQQNQRTSYQKMERQITQIEWNLGQKFNQRINLLEQIQFHQRSDPDLEECRIRPSPIRKQLKDAETVKIMDIRQTNAIDSREHNIMKLKEEFKIYLRSITHRTEESIKLDFNLIQKLQQLHTH